MPINCTEAQEIVNLVDGAVAEYGNKRADLIPILQRVSNDCGFISETAINEISKRTKLHPSEIHAVATFYRMLLTKPHGRHIIQFCESAPCHVVGGRELFEALKETLKIKPGETSPDNRWTFFTTSCLGVCGIAPVLLIDTDTYGNVRPEQLPDILKNYE